ncbi:MAG: DUF2062 domain-containing protein [Blastocatellia bacterium]
MLRRAFRNLLNLEEPPERTALAFAVGTFIAFTPLFGLHLMIAGLLLLVWRTNKAALFTGLFLTNPWTIAPVAAASWGIGRMIVNSPPVELPTVTFSALVSSGFWLALASQWRQLLPYWVGAMILAILASLIAYPLMLSMLRTYRRKYMTNVLPETETLSG